MRKDLTPERRVIVAVDVSSVMDALKVVSPLREFDVGFKLGLEFIYSTLRNLASLPMDQAEIALGDLRGLLKLLSGKLFLDTKGMDIPNTMKAAAGNIAPMGVRFFNLFCLGGKEMMEEVVAARNAARESGAIGADQAKVLGVTILTSLNYRNLQKMGIVNLPTCEFRSQEADDREVQQQLQEIVRLLALLGKEAGLDGVISSAKEAPAIRQACGDDFLIVTPGIRPEWAAVGDQKRPVTPADAINNLGADLLVIGRPITKPPAEIGGPIDALKRILDEIAAAI